MVQKLSKKTKDKVKNLFLTEVWVRGRKSARLPAKLSLEKKKERKQMEEELLKETGKTWKELVMSKEFSQERTEMLAVGEELKIRQQRIKEDRDQIQFCKDHNIPIKLKSSVEFLLLHINNAIFIGKGFVPSDKSTPEKLLNTSAQIVKSEILKNTTKAERELLYKVFYVSQEKISSLSNSPDKMEQLIGRADQHIMDILCEKDKLPPLISDLL